jgi:hypothetical protein
MRIQKSPYSSLGKPEKKVQNFLLNPKKEFQRRTEQLRRRRISKGRA